MTATVVKGWCPGAHRPMMSGDGLVVRVRPFCAELNRAQALGLCEAAETFGNGVLDLTSRGNLQIRGVAEDNFETFLSKLDQLGVIDSDPAIERHRNILMPPLWERGDLTDRLYQRLLQTLPHLPDLPEKMGFAIDTGDDACLADGSADLRLELNRSGGLLLRADGAVLGRAVTEENAMIAVLELARWFVHTGGRSHGRMARHLPHCALPQDWATCAPRPQDKPLAPGELRMGTLFGAPFGKIAAVDLRDLLHRTQPDYMRLTLERLFFLPGVRVEDARGFETQPSRIMEVHACPGAPYCPQASVETLTVARNLAEHTQGMLHVSGCAKGCAFPRKAKRTLIGREGRFDLVSDGKPWDEPCQRGLDPSSTDELANLI